MGCFFCFFLFFLKLGKGGEKGEALDWFVWRWTLSTRLVNF